jgi:hypothetical protein
MVRSISASGSSPTLEAYPQPMLMVTGDARALDELLSVAGFEEWRSTPDGVVVFVPPADLRLGTGLWFTPVLPHGEFAEAMRGPIV